MFNIKTKPWLENFKVASFKTVWDLVFKNQTKVYHNVTQLGYLEWCHMYFGVLGVSAQCFLINVAFCVLTLGQTLGL